MNMTGKQDMGLLLDRKNFKLHSEIELTYWQCHNKRRSNLHVQNPLPQSKVAMKVRNNGH
jgi:hypothetical protein